MCGDKSTKSTFGELPWAMLRNNYKPMMVLVCMEAEMNRLEKEEERQRIFAAYGYECVVCGESVMKYGTPQLAHQIADTKANKKKWGKAVIDDPLNRLPVCGLKCNDKCNIGNNPEACKDLEARIIEARR